MHEWLEKKWTTLTGPYTADDRLKEKLLQEIERKYGGSGRHYHTLTHIHGLICLAEQYRQHLQQKEVVEFAILYHDIIYNVWRKDNEERSAILACKRLDELGIPAGQVQAVKVFIEATASHTLGPGIPFEQDAKFFLDFDLSVLGAEWPEYFAYTGQVRKEYHIYPDMLYRAGRRKFLQNSLGAAAIFHTTIFRDQYEARARQNMEKELQLLAS